MKIIEPSAKLINPICPEDGLCALQFIERMARISHRSEDAQTDDSWKRFISFVVLEKGDWSVVEHSSATVIFRVDRGITHELVRHRLFSFTQESTRFVKYGGKQVQELEFIKPVEILANENDEDGYYVLDDFQHVCGFAEKAYLTMIGNKARPQEARSVLPNALASTIAMTGNFRVWRWFFLARTTKESHPDMRRATIPLLRTFQKRIPILYDDIIGDCRQIDNFKKAH